MDGRGYSVNIPWSHGGVGDHDYIFAFQHIVLPIGHAISDFTIKAKIIAYYVLFFMSYLVSYNIGKNSSLLYAISV